MKFFLAAHLLLNLTTGVLTEAAKNEKNAADRGMCNSKIPLTKGVKQLFNNAGVTHFNLKPVGSTTALIPEAADAAISGATVADGQSGDTDFPHGDLKALVTVGEVSICKDTLGEMIVGVPDGMGAYLVDNKTVRLVVQSESYGPLENQSYPLKVNNGAATFTGSHVQYVDMDRARLSKFMTSNMAAKSMVKGVGEVITKMYNLKGEPVAARNKDGATSVGAHYSNTDAAGNYVVALAPTRADWLLQSLCSSHLEQKHQWGAGIGVEDTLFITNEEWMDYVPGIQAMVGLSAHAINMEDGATWAVGSMTLGGFEKIVEINSFHKDYVIFSPSGYNGNFGDYSAVIAKRNAMGTRNDGNPYVKPENIVPARIYIGVKGKMEDGSDAPEDDFLARNGLRYGKLYGFAIDMSPSGPTQGLWRDAFHKDTTLAVNGAEVNGVFTPINWQWDGQVKNFEYDGSWDFQEQPPNHIGSNNMFWNSNGNNSGGCKCEHNSPDPRNGKSGFIQGSTCGYFGHYYLNDIKAVLDAAGGDLPSGDISATYFMYQGETDITSQVELGGKGQYASYNENGADAKWNFDSATGFKKTFEDIDGLEIIEGPGENLYAVIQEDSGNKLGERMFISEALHHDGPLTYYFVAMSGGELNTRMAAGVGIPAGTNAGASAHEFSGVFDLSGLLVRSGEWQWAVGADDEGHVKRAADRTVDINDKMIMLGLQSHNLAGGVIKDFGADRGGQWLAYQPNIPSSTKKSIFAGGKN